VRTPIFIATEDLQWADPSTLEVIQLLVEQVPTAPLMVICTGRSGFDTQWQPPTHYTRVALDRLRPVTHAR
jgi:predicted ATPase